MQSAASHSSWKAQLSLEFEHRAQRTIITRRQHAGPLVIQKPFYPEGEACHIYLLHPPGGLVGGDQLNLDVRLHSGSHTLITTPGAAKFYRSAGPVAQQTQTFNIGDKSLLEWLPQETIAFNHTNALVHTRVNLETDAKFIGWEITCLGRQASNDLFNAGRFVQKLEVSIANKPLLIERALFEGGSELLCAPWGLANHPTVGTMIITPATQDLAIKIRENVQVASGELFSATLMDNIIVCRYLGPQAETAKRLFVKVWEIARPSIYNKKVCAPRIWNT
ncbi:urease accessory protein UreD [Kaarinaea lacus]